MKQVPCTWLAVSQELPQEEGIYLVTCQLLDGDERYVDVSVWQEGQWEITLPGNERVRPARVIAWMPFPDPY